jgi:membrane protease YdiL (CAAX protease family)
VLPNEVYLLVAVGLVSMWLRNGGLGGAGLRKPRSWGWIAVAAIATAMLLQVEDVVTDPIGRLFTHDPQRLSSILPQKGDLRRALVALGFVWTSAAFGEEIGYRAYLMTRFGEVAGGGRLGKAISLIAVSVLFGFGHYYKGPAGVVESTASGLLLAGVYLATGNLWAPILAHGLSDTFAIAALYNGWFSP